MLWLGQIPVQRGQLRIRRRSKAIAVSRDLRLGCLKNPADQTDAMPPRHCSDRLLQR